MRPSIYLSALTLSLVRTESRLVEEIWHMIQRGPDSTISIADSFNELDLTGLGFRRMTWTGEWWIKEAARSPGKPDVTEVYIELVEDEAALREFGVGTYEGFETPGAIRASGPLGMRHPITLNDPRMRYFVGRVDGQVVTSSIAYIGDDIVGIYGVSTLPEFRNRGYGKAVTWAAAMSHHGLDVAMQPSSMARGIESELGFRKIAEYTLWVREVRTP